MERTSEEVLTEYLETKDGDLLAILYERMRRKMLSVAVRILHSLDDAEDVVQDVFCRLVEVEPQPIMSAESFLFKMTQNAALNFKEHDRSGVRDGMVSQETFEPTARIEDDAEHDGSVMPKHRDFVDSRSLSAESDAPPKKELPDDVKAALSHLPPEQKDAVELFHARGMTISEIAEMLRVTEEAAETLVDRGTIALRDALVVKDNQVPSRGPSKPVCAINPDTGATAHEFASIGKASRAVGCGERHLQTALKKGTPYRGYLWSYANAV